MHEFSPRVLMVAEIECCFTTVHVSTESLVASGELVFSPRGLLLGSFI